MRTVAAYHATIVQLAGGCVFGFGEQIGLGDGTAPGNVLLPQLLRPLAGSTSIGLSIGGCAVESGAVVCWGPNIYGQLDDGTTVAHYWPASTIPP